MSDLLSNPAFKYYTLAAVVLIFNPLLLAGYTGAVRARHKGVASPEDAKLTGGTYSKENHPDVDRVLAAHRNALENVAFALLAGLIYVLNGASATMVGALMGIVAVFRWSHSICCPGAACPTALRSSRPLPC